jgi:hypothetical protein
MKRLLLASLTALWVLAAVSSLVMAAPVVENKTDLNRDLAAVRAATAPFHEVEAALAAGYVAVPVEHCVAVPGVGGMGMHYINMDLVMDPAIDLTRPEVLLYEPTADGPRLVGVEYFYAIGAPDAPIPVPAPPAPVLFGRNFDGPMLGHEPGMPPHYDLHVWVWRNNPDGMFAPYNPNVSCP